MFLGMLTIFYWCNNLKYAKAFSNRLPYQENISPSTKMGIVCCVCFIISLACSSLNGKGSEDKST